jgi:LacI family transcriptional regulator
MTKPSRRSRGAVTIEDVARAAGVSAMTVSRVVNGGKNVRDSTRLAVQETVALLNYFPNSAARSLAAGDASHIGLLYANPSAAYLSQFLIGALEAARRSGAHLVLESCESDDAQDQADVARRLAQSDVDGFILPPPLSESQPILAELQLVDMPLVTVAMGLPHDKILNVRIDDHAAAAEMTRHLISLGHRRIGLIKGHPNHVASHDRARGFSDTLKANGIPVEDGPVEQGYFSYRSGMRAAERLLALPNPPTAIFACNDDMAAAAVSVAHRLGMSVPGDLSVVGFDDTALATTIWPELSTVRQPIAEMAEAAVEMLLTEINRRRLGGRRQQGERVLTHDLIIRESSGKLVERKAEVLGTARDR